MQTTIAALIVRHFGEDVTDEAIQRITAIALGYLFRVSTATAMADVLRDELGHGVKVIDFRKDLQVGYYLKNVKLWIWRIVAKGHSPGKARAMMRRYQIEDGDIELARLARTHPKLAPALKKLSRKHRSHSLKAYDRVLERCLEDCDLYIHKFAVRKLRFLTFSGFMSIDDIELELKYFAVYGMLLQYPVVETRLHLTNVAKRAVHNFGMNMIQQHTTQGRAHMRREDDGTFTAIKLSIDSGATAHAYHKSLSSDITGAQVDGSSSNSFSDKITVDGLLDRHEGKKRKLLVLLQGHYDADFSNWLHGLGLPDNDELMDKHLKADAVNKYVNLVADYLNVGSYKVNVFLNELRAQL